MKEINELIREYKPNGYKKLGNVILVNTKEDKLIIKKKTNDNNIYEYLNSRSFRYYPRIIDENDNYRITEYIKEIDYPEEQKIIDMINLISLLHNKTTFYKDVDEDDYKKIYEDIDGNIEYLKSYYIDMITIIESKVYMSPSEYLLARNISKVFASLNYFENELEQWLEIRSDKKKTTLCCFT